MKKFIGKKIKLKELPTLYFGNPSLTIGNYYEIIDVEGSNFWFIDNDGNKTNCWMGRFYFDEE
jgi:hypothetical protein